jgi:O-antigen/teichoic acid export membrane protein
MLHIADESSVSQAQCVVLILGVACALELLTISFKGVITGSGRYDVESTILGGSHILEVGAMIVVLLQDASLVRLATVVFGFQCLRLLASAVAAKSVCPQLRISFRRCSCSALTQVLVFGGKSFLFMTFRTVMYQFNAIMIAHFLGPGMLAVFARQRALVMHGESLMLRYAHALVPVASAMDAKSDREGLRELLIKASLYSVYIVLPFVISLIVMGGPIVRFWMGSAYESPVVLGILAIGHLLVLSQRGTVSIVMALDRHGLLAIGMVMASVIGVLLAWFLLGPMEMGLAGAAIALVFPLTLFSGLGTMLVGCSVTGISVREYLRKTLLGPVRIVLPFAAWLVVARWLCGTNALSALIAGLVPGTVILLGTYWCFVLPGSLKNRITKLPVGLFRKRIRTTV